LHTLVATDDGSIHLFFVQVQITHVICGNIVPHFLHSILHPICTLSEGDAERSTVFYHTLCGGCKIFSNRAKCSS
jgi:hypothetical protein